MSRRPRLSPHLAASAGAPTAPPAPDRDQPLRVRGLSAAYGARLALHGVDFDVPAGQLTAIVGPNGAGKSTLLKAVLGITPKLAGEVLTFGRPVARSRDRIAYVPQRASVDWEFPARACDVVAMGLYRRLGPFRLAGRAERETVRAALADVGLEAFAERQIGRLSGGQQQRVFLARALVQGADLLLLDEPFAGVDAATEGAILRVLQAQAARGGAVVCVHHTLATVRGVFDRALLVNQSVIAEGAVDSVLTPERLAIAYGGPLPLEALGRDAAATVSPDDAPPTAIGKGARG